jgi:transcriptional regulator with XRE-family HTH domain
VSDLRAILVVKLRRAADAKGLDDRALAVRSGLCRKTITRMWRGEVSWDTLEQVARSMRLRIEIGVASE